ncbi:MAG: imidazole glycerol phosphate synthase subunit HisH, partial [Candidatus Bathyarchaeota archaeon]|nr:imidazole glycerol phosphate synthase subunit HisH [Candidatus Bathyarchaeota archaeon]
MPAELSTVGIIDSGMGNILSVCNALIYLGAEVKVCTSPDELNGIERIVLPGVGSFDHYMAFLHETGLFDALKQKVEIEKIPIMGICLGMQVMASRGTEGNEVQGLGWI